MGSKILSSILKVASVAAPLIPGIGTGVGAALGAAGGILGGSEKEKGPTYIYNGQESSVAPAEAEPFKPTQPAPLTRPGSLNELAAFAPEQERSAIATKGLNQGLADDEDAYYRNLIQRSLIGSDNTVTGSMNSLLPIEQQYFGKRGVPMNDINSFLKGLST